MKVASTSIWAGLALPPSSCGASKASATPPNTGSGLDSADPDGDGINNLLEYATGTNPLLTSLVPISFTKTGAIIEFVYAKNKAATDVTCFVEWSDTLMNDWSTTGVTSSVLSDNGTTQQIKALVPAEATSRFVRLQVTQP